MLIRRDITVNDYSDIIADKFGFKKNYNVWLGHTKKQRSSKNDKHKKRSLRKLDDER